MTSSRYVYLRMVSTMIFSKGFSVNWIGSGSPDKWNQAQFHLRVSMCPLMTEYFLSMCIAILL
jgi:hypothetical protein